MSISEVVGGHAGGSAGTEVPCEVLACAVGRYNEAHARLEVELDSYLRPTGLRPAVERLEAPWLPQKSRAVEHVELSEAVALTKEIFQSWVRKVRNSIPSLVSPSGK